MRVARNSSTSASREYRAWRPLGFGSTWVTAPVGVPGCRPICASRAKAWRYAPPLGRSRELVGAQLLCACGRARDEIRDPESRIEERIGLVRSEFAVGEAGPVQDPPETVPRAGEVVSRRA